MSETYHDISEETLNDVMLAIVEASDRADPAYSERLPPQAAGLRKRRIPMDLICWDIRLPSGETTRTWSFVDEMQGR